MKFIKSGKLLIATMLIASTGMVFASGANKEVTIDLWNATLDQASMGNIATDNNEKGLYNPETNTLQVGTNPVDVSGYMSAVTKIQYDQTGKGNFVDVKILTTDTIETGTKNDGVNHTVEYISSFEIELPTYLNKKGVEYIPIKMAVPYTPMDVVVGTGYLDARLRINWDEMGETSLVKYEPNTEMSAGKVKKVEKVDVKTGINIKANSTVLPTEAQINVNKITEGVEADKVKELLKVNSAEIFDISATEGGQSIQPNGSVEITFPYSGDLKIYRIDNDKKVLLRGTYTDKDYTVLSKELGKFAILNGTNNYKEVIEEKPKDEASDDTSNDVKFTDITGHWAEKNIYAAVSAELFGGVSKTQFSPNTKMTNAMAITVLHRIAGKPEVVAEDDKWYSKAMAWGLQEGIIGGYNKFEADKNITREALATMIYKYEETKQGELAVGDLSSFKDADLASDWAKEALAWANKEGIVGGKTKDTIEPKLGATRAEVATMLMRYINR